MLKELQKNLNEQDNRGTANPIFVVYDYEKVPSCKDFTDKFMYVHSDGIIGDTREDLIEFVKNNSDVDLPVNYKNLDVDELLKYINEFIFDDVDKVYYIKKKVFINVFFTEKSANAFIKQNHYNYSKEIHTYVGCLYRNEEMQFIRDSLKDGLFQLKGDDKK